MGGSMGSVVGEKIARLGQRSLERKYPLVLVSASGGARMQEGVLSLMQMAKTSALLSQLAERRIPYVSILTNPTTGGVSASYAMLGDAILAEPGAVIGFAGPRVIKQTIGPGPARGISDRRVSARSRHARRRGPSPRSEEDRWTAAPSHEWQAGGDGVVVALSATRPAGHAESAGSLAEIRGHTDPQRCAQWLRIVVRITTRSSICSRGRPGNGVSGSNGWTRCSGDGPATGVAAGVPRGRHERKGKRVRDARSAYSGRGDSGPGFTARRTSSIFASAFWSTACRFRRTTSCPGSSAARPWSSGCTRRSSRRRRRWRSSCSRKRARRRGRRGRTRRAARRHERADAAGGGRLVDRDRSRGVSGRHAGADRVGESRDLQAGRPAVIGERDPAIRDLLARFAREAGAAPVHVVTDECTITGVELHGELGPDPAALWGRGRGSPWSWRESARGCTPRSRGCTRRPTRRWRS